ncbi:lytic transglycosylase domain-containing protein [Aliagarivorans taiwanensis]|uniref:lytic transglycosylase domain-containing protein n=1 Tax=Aliagarivorans taiwanensis TaxID=561966 RepID=UPI00047D9AC3|nr:lytic transglycosylase domain-containing protein [Aliagarivorans taiwanensis]
MSKLSYSARCATALLLLSSAATADVWYFQDERGVMHFSQTRKSDKWQLLMRTPSGATFQAPRLAPAPSRQKLGYDQYIQKSAVRYALDPALIHAVIAVESNYQVDAVSRAGAMGLMQLMPATAKRFSVSDPFEAEQNIDAGSKYLRWLLDEFDSLSLALAGYNAGENAVKRYGNQIPPFNETQNYVEKVMRRYRENLTALQ